MQAAEPVPAARAPGRAWGARAGLEATELGFKPTGPIFVQGHGGQGQLLGSQHLPCHGTTSQPSSVSPTSSLQGLSAQQDAWRTRPKCFSTLDRFPGTARLVCQGLFPLLCSSSVRGGRGKRAPRAAEKQLHGARSCPGKARNNSHTGKAQTSSSFRSAQEACPDTWDPNLSPKPPCAARSP